MPRGHVGRSKTKTKKAGSSNLYKKKSKWRQQKLAVGTIENIAKRVHKQIENRDVETYYDEQFITAMPEAFDDMIREKPTGSLLNMGGCWSEDTYLQQNQNFWGPQTALVQPSIVNGVASVATTDGFRKGQSIFLKGITFKGGFILPSKCYNAKIKVLLVRHKVYDGSYAEVQQITLNPYGYNYNVDLVLKNNYTKIYEKTINLSQHAGRNGVYSTNIKTMNFFIPINKKIDYRLPDDLIDPISVDKLDLVKGHYQLYFYSDMNLWAEGEPEIDPEKSPQVWGRLRWLYTDQ